MLPEFEVLERTQQHLRKELLVLTTALNCESIRLHFHGKYLAYSP